VGADLIKRDRFRFRPWQAGLLVIVLVMALGMIRSGASWGSSSYDPVSDPYSMQNVLAGDGASSWSRAGYTGNGVDVALIDTGVAPVPGLSGGGKIVNGPDLSLESQNPSFEHLDTNGHGTFMAGIIGGNDGQAGGYRGVAPGARILSVKVADADGGVDVSQVIAAIDWVVQHRYDNGMNIRVINLSYGTSSLQPYTVDPLAFAVEQAWKAGIVVVTAAGNTGIGTGLSDPAYDPWMISVGAADTMGTPNLGDDRAASFSAGTLVCSPKDCQPPTLLAPGVHMQGLRDPGSFIDQTNPDAALGALYFRGSGTSEAAAYVTGAVALLLQKYPLLTPDQVRQMLAQSTDHLGWSSPRMQGSGELDLNRLLYSAVPKAPSGPSVASAAHWPADPHGHVGHGPAAADRSGPENCHVDPQGPRGCPWSTGTGSLELSRGGVHLSMNGVLLQGERDIFGMPFDSVAMAALEANDSSWSGGGMWNGSQWTGSSWSGSSWSGSSWSGSSWSGSSWSGSSWSDLIWSGNSWSGSSWSGSSWSGSSWSGSSWSGSSWSGSSWSSAVWAGDQWLGASWG
jgi:serine protease AprX